VEEVSKPWNGSGTSVFVTAKTGEPDSSPMHNIMETLVRFVIDDPYFLDLVLYRACFMISQSTCMTACRQFFCPGEKSPIRSVYQEQARWSLEVNKKNTAYIGRTFNQ
jgi:hypothetical protein